MENFGINSERSGQEEDRISALPDELLHHILSLDVELKVVVQTSVLSKRWVNLWSTFPFLNFKAHPLSHEIDGLHRNDATCCNFITKFLLNRNQHSGPCIVNIDLNPFNECVGGIILSILSHAVSHSVLELQISNARVDSYLSFQALRTLSLNQCNGALTKWSLPCLTTLHLEYLFHTGDDLSFKDFLCLKNLSMGAITGEAFRTDSEVVRIDAPNLENLTIFQGNTMPPNCVFVVLAPKLKYFRFWGRYLPVFYAEDGFPCLEVVEFDIDINQENDIYMYTYEDYNLEDENQVNEIMLKISSLFRVFRETKALTLHQETIKVLSRVQDFSKFRPSPFLNLNSVYLVDYVPPGPPLPRYDQPVCSPNHVINYLLSNAPGAEIIMQKQTWTQISIADDNTSGADPDT